MDKHDNDFAITREDLRGTTPEPTYGGVTSFMRRKYSKDLNGTPRTARVVRTRSTMMRATAWVRTRASRILRGERRTFQKFWYTPWRKMTHDEIPNDEKMTHDE